LDTTETTAGSIFGEHRDLACLAAFTYGALLFLMPSFHFVYDLKCWENWSLLLYEHGLVAAYDPALSTIDYMPLYLYVLKTYTWLCGSREAILANINHLKGLTLFFEVVSIAMLASMVKGKDKQLLFFIIGILNIGFLYNNMFWQQVDGILAFFLLTSFVFASQNRTMLSVVFFMLAFNFKTQAIILLPLLGILWLNGITLKKLLKCLFVALTVQAIIILPFLLNGNARHIFEIAFNSYGHYRKVSLNAYNIWYLVLDAYPPHVNDRDTWMGISYHHYGLLMYIGSIIIIISPFMYLLIRNKCRIPVGISHKFMLLSAALLPYVFFYFNTQMHERYIHCSIIFLTFLAFRYGHWALYLIVSLNYFISLEGLLSVNRFIAKIPWLFDQQLTALIFTIGLAWLFTLWYREWKISKPLAEQNTN
jgi:Gpi18-like mannosyltransferase